MRLILLFRFFILFSVMLFRSTAFPQVSQTEDSQLSNSAFPCEYFDGQTENIVSEPNPAFRTPLLRDSTSGKIKSDSLDTQKISDIKFTPNQFKEITITRQNFTEVKIDGELNEPVWKKISRYYNFSEVSPGDNTKPEVDTEVMMYYDDDNLYFGFICRENNMDKLRKSIAERDKIFQDDFCGFFLDTYDEGRQAYELFVNPYGIQGDLLWTTPGMEDESFDMIWYSAAKEYKDKWTLEIAIPFKSIRFPDKNVQDWQIQFMRIRPRENRSQYSLMPLSRDDPTLFTHACKINGVSYVKGGKNIEILPSFTSSQAGQISDYNNADSPFDNDKIKGELGVNVKYGITSTLTADATYNPDFSQVESDAGVITANNIYAIFYNEKRPFFLEGANIFQSPTQVVYTRSINNPLYATKLTGKIGKTEIGYLIANDRKTPFILPFKESSDFLATERHSLSNILRLKHTIKDDDSYIGFVFTDREISKEWSNGFDFEGYNRNFGVDGKYRFLKNYSVDFQVLKSVSKEMNYPDYYNPGTFDNGKYTDALDGESFSGMQYNLTLNRDARHWSYNANFSAVSPNVRRDNGYISSNDNISLSTWQGYMFYSDTKFLQRIQPQLYVHWIHDYSGRYRETYLQFDIWMQFVNQISVDIGFHPVNSEVWGGVYNQGARALSINFNVNTFKAITLGGYFNIGRSIIRSDNPSVGYIKSVSLWSTFKPVNSLVMYNTWDYYELAENYGGELLYAGYIFRNTSTFNFTKEISLRLIGEFNSFSGSFYINPLLSYKPNPFTIFYFGFTNSYNDINAPDGRSKYVMTDRQFFLKMQYLFRI